MYFSIVLNLVQKTNKSNGSFRMETENGLISFWYLIFFFHLIYIKVRVARHECLCDNFFLCFIVKHAHVNF